MEPSAISLSPQSTQTRVGSRSSCFAASAMPTPIGSPCPERSGRDVDPRDARGRVALEHAPVRAVVEDLLVGDDTRGPVDRVQQRGRVALGEDEPVVRRALRLGEVVAEIAVDEDREQVSCGHRGRGMSRPCGCAHPHRVDAELLSELSPSLRRRHARHSTFVPRTANVDAWRAAGCTSFRSTESASGSTPSRARCSRPAS